MSAEKPSMDDARTHAKELLTNARHAMAEMKEQLASSKEVLGLLAVDMGGDPRNKGDLEHAKHTFQNSLNVTIIDNPAIGDSTRLMTRMYSLYEKIFPIAEEREELDKLLSLMEKNHDKKLQASGAPFREQWIIVQHPNTGEVIAARNVITFSAAKDKEVSKEIDGTQHLIYGFVDPRFRSMGLGDFTMGIAEDEARKFLATTYKGRSADSMDMVQISEQNAPLLMSMESMLVDTAGAKTDQFWRREYYESLGFRELSFDYIQLPLEPRADGGEPSDELNLITRGVPAPAGGRGLKTVMTDIPANSVRFHLYNFFDRSVAAGQYEVEADPDWIKQSAALEGTIAVKPKLDFMGLKDKAWLFMEQYIGGKRFKPDAFSGNTVGDMMGIEAIPAQAASGNDNATPKAAPKAPAGPK
jgi:GNAT superfamily N-acetyltransferase